MPILAEKRVCPFKSRFCQSGRVVGVKRLPGLAGTLYSNYICIYQLPVQPYKKITFHILAWLVYLLTQVLGAAQLDRNFWIPFLCTNLPLVALFYANTGFVFPRFMKKGRYVFLFSLLLLVLLVSVVIRFAMLIVLMNGTVSDLMDAPIVPMFWSQARLALLFTAISFGVWYARRNFEIMQNQQLLEKEIADARLMSLRNQINPHFLYNTLSFLYTRALPLSEELSNAIGKLSEMMRYSLGEAGEEGKVPLEKEVNHLRNFIDIHQMRYAHALQVQVSVEGDLSRYRILPLLLITFVENAFKHGAMSDRQNPLVVRLSAGEKKMVFEVKNKKSSGIKEKSSGVGLQNTRNRLDLAYPGKYRLDINDTSEQYTVTLTLENTKI
jgi:two-component system, LytTR family, sensor kinase